MIISHDEDGSCRVQVGAELNIYQAAECAADLRRLLADPVYAQAQLLLDLSQVQELDTAGLQLLIQVQRHCASREAPLRFVKPSPVVREMAQLLGLQEIFGVGDVGAADSGQGEFIAGSATP